MPGYRHTVSQLTETVSQVTDIPYPADRHSLPGDRHTVSSRQTQFARLPTYRIQQTHTGYRLTVSIIQQTQTENRQRQLARLPTYRIQQTESSQLLQRQHTLVNAALTCHNLSFHTRPLHTQPTPRYWPLLTIRFTVLTKSRGRRWNQHTLALKAISYAGTLALKVVSYAGTT